MLVTVALTMIAVLLLGMVPNTVSESVLKISDIQSSRLSGSPNAPACPCDQAEIFSSCWQKFRRKYGIEGVLPHGFHATSGGIQTCPRQSLSPRGPAAYSKKSTADIEASVVLVRRTAKSAASEPPVLTSTMTSAPAMSLMWMRAAGSSADQLSRRITRRRLFSSVFP
jgi:hypothetical protein